MVRIIPIEPENVAFFGALQGLVMYSGLPGVNEVPIDRRIAMKAGALVDFHGDPADRIVVATALALKTPICTRDHKIIDYASASGSSLEVLVC